MKILECKSCGKYMGVLRDAKVRNNMVVYCKECAARIDDDKKRYDVPDFMSNLFRS